MRCGGEDFSRNLVHAIESHINSAGGSKLPLYTQCIIFQLTRLCIIHNMKDLFLKLKL
jgi:hypothetical protein